MRTFFLLVFFLTLLLAPRSTVWAGEAPASQTAARADAAEARYRAWVEQEHAKDAAAFAKEKAAIEDKYKGYVRPAKKKDAKAAPTPAKSE